MERLTSQRVLVTGGAGFIGGHLVELLLKRNYHVTVIDIQKPCASYFFQKSLDQKAEYRIVDIRKRRQVESFFTLVNPAYVIHLAALPIVRDAYDHPLATFETNIMGTVNILESCRKSRNIKGIIVASSDKAYGKTNVSYTEDCPLKGDHPYDVSKTCTDLLAQTYYKTYGLPVVVTRFGNVYGEGDLYVDRIIPGICASLVTHTPLAIRSDGTFVRDYIYVKDVAGAYFFLLKKISSLIGQAYNIGSDTTCSVLGLIALSERILRRKIPYTVENTAVNEIPYQHLNDTKIRKLGWKNRHGFKKVLPGILRWYVNNKDRILFTK